jgi:tetratricopeptide (TPR) repeat protein
MRTALRLAFLVLQVSSLCLLPALFSVAAANGGMTMRAPPPRVQTPQDKARDAYNDGVHDVKKADKAAASAAEATDAGRKQKAAQEAQGLYSSAHAKFSQATELDPSMHEGWNYVGYTSRKLGNYDEALSAYGKALTLKPGYADAIEYRGEAYLGLNRIPDAQQAYLDLYAGNRQLAAKLLSAMRSWVAAQRANPSPGNVSLDELDKWIAERTQIAGQTAALTREGTQALWR